jgi:hypothetical protein
MTMNTLSRLGAGCGALFAVLLVVAAGDGGFTMTGAVMGLFALSLAIPFLCCLGGLLRAADPGNRWLADTAVAAGVGGIILKTASDGPNVALHRGHVASDTSLHKTLSALADAATVASLFPLAVCCAAAGIVVLRTNVLPKWLGAGAGVVAVALAVNGCFLTASFVPGLLAFALWTLLTSVWLVRPRRLAPTDATSDPALARRG